MQKRVAGTIKLTNAEFTIGMGFVPHWFKITNLVNQITIEWNMHMMRLAGNQAGILTIADGTRSALTIGAGVKPYKGSTDKLTADDATLLVRKDTSHRLTSGDAQGNGITTWTRTTNADPAQGKFNTDVDANINPDTIAGAPVVIRDNHYGTVYRTFIAALTGDGDADNNITLTENVPSGTVHFLGSPYDYVGAVNGQQVPAGITFSETSSLNDTDAELAYFEAGCYDVNIFEPVARG